jgi:DNA-binding CsgD family transcriptional regulator
VGKSALLAAGDEAATARGMTVRRAAGAGTASLTSQEREIALLAASGQSKKEIGAELFLSHRTVGAHLYRIFPELGVTSRAALRDALGAQADERER